MKTEIVPPLALTQSLGKQYPDLWDDIDMLRRETISGKIDLLWDFDLCYCPIAASMAALGKYKSGLELSGDSGIVAACAAWRRSKMIYRFDDALADELVSMADDIVIPIEILRSLPAPALYIQFEHPSAEFLGPDGQASKIDGFLVHIEHDVNTHEKELRINYLTTKGSPAYVVFIHLIPGGTVEDGIKAAVETAKKNLPNIDLPKKMKEFTLQNIRESATIAKEAIQLVLYICAENAEIRENEEQSKIYRKSDRVQDKYRELRRWDVGVKTGIILRAVEKRDREQKKNEDAATPRSYTRTRKTRPHVRRAHWHHFWTGSANEKRLILRWVNSVIVNADDGEVSPVVIPLKD